MQLNGSDKMPITKEEAEIVLGASPTEKVFVKAAGTLEAYQKANEVLGGYEQLIGSIYGDPKGWSPKAVIESIKKYSETVKSLIEKSKDIVSADPLLGPKYSELLVEGSKKVTVFKNMALPWLQYIKDRNVYNEVQSGIVEEATRAQKEALAKQTPELAELLTKLDEINKE